MAKNYSKDVQVLTYILVNQKNIRDVARRFGCDFSQYGANSVINDKMAFDLCAMYMAQIGESVKNLSPKTKDELSNVINVDVLRYFRNVISHTYEKVDKHMLVTYIQLVQSDTTVKRVRELLNRCNASKRLPKQL